MRVVDKCVIHNAKAESLPLTCEEITSSDESRYCICDLSYQSLKPLKQIIHIFRVTKLLF